ncbi:hypothetical protein [Pontibacter harenae]|uniref:hypothetical protein n=1 Tax=Pontibacter harenae TaxID=2894083 RepID=UPI001E51EF80|nr:hypothetical protein [Pontibacter harenae]MCC9167796.1 hypothetical protein [Pontibacter harenae]
MEATTKTMYRSGWQAMMAVFAIFVMVSCGGNNKVGSENFLSGPDNKTWRASKQLSATGDTEPLKQEEQEAQTVQFYADGRFAMGGDGANEKGTWSFDQAAKRLSLHFAGQDVTENFEVEKLTENELRLKANDGSTMELEAE